ncbi:MAG TPA: ACT domain-containing protein [Thermodesulfobacteriota bacterium]|nr:ACT domain-containing protein [Thermodesulfobacteriota bacterium]
MEKKTQLSVILTNAPGELSKLCDVLKESNVNILAMSIQNAKDSVKELFNMREKTGRRIALAESYRGILKDSSDYSLIRVLVDKPIEAEKALVKANHLIDKDQVLVFRLVNQPGMLGRVAKRFGESNVNIDYIYGSAMDDASESIFVVHIAESDFDRIKNFFEDL